LPSSNGDWNVALFLKDNAPERVKAAREERDKLVARVRELNLEIAVLETHIQIGSEVPVKREEDDAEPVRPG
jgi:hypothetical protein